VWFQPQVEVAMSIASRFRVLVVCLALEVGVISGVPMRPGEIQELMNQMNQPKWAHILPSENDDGDDPPEPVT
jgi:hypothetical protein